MMIDEEKRKIGEMRELERPKKQDTLDMGRFYTLYSSKHV